MPARSSLIPGPLGQLTDAVPTGPDDLPGLLTCLGQVPDPRRNQGRCHPLAFVLSLAACAVLAGAKSLAAIAEWAAGAPPHVLARLGGPCQKPDRGPVAPAEATVRRILQRIDGDALDTAVGSWLEGNQSTLHRWLKALPWREVPLLDKARATAHGRDEIRRIKAAAVTGIAFPHAVQAVQIVRRRRIVTTGKVTLERVHGVTDLTAEQADATEIARRVRGHWGIENKIHHPMNSDNDH